MPKERATSLIQKVVIFFFITAAKAAAARGQQSDNTAEFMAMCQLMRGSVQGFDVPQLRLSEQALKAFKDISVAHALAYSNTTETEVKLKELLPEKTTWQTKITKTNRRAKAVAQINKSIEVAKAVKTAIDGKIEAAQSEIKKANAELLAALTGRASNTAAVTDDGNFMATSQDDEMFGTASTTNKNCGGTGAGGGSNGDNTGTSLINDLLCLCAIGPTATTKLCGHINNGLTAGNEGYANSSTSIKTAYRTFISLCPKLHAEPTPSTLAAALAAVKNNIGRQQRDGGTGDATGLYIMGYAHNSGTGCTGASSQACVNYKLQLSNAGKGIPWEAKILKAIKTAEKALPPAGVEAAEAQLLHINATTWQIYESALDADSSNTQYKPNKQIERLDPNKEAECKQYKPKKTCEEKSCKWEGDEATGKCQPKEGEEHTKTSAAQEMELQQRRQQRNAKGKNKKTAKVVANGREQRARIPLFSLIRNLL
uniref:Variant surface glycoprotein 1087 n=1 Tax=Trypanosoma brucei TaxID=5691 RepID=M4SZA0_9TRYP|nr:variant surface glycoprotein 1087 [Trypanosoma brucei]